MKINWNLRKNILPKKRLTKEWALVLTYKSRGYKNRLNKVGRSRTIIENPEITKQVKRNGAYKLVYKSINYATRISIK